MLNLSQDNPIKRFSVNFKLFVNPINIIHTVTEDARYSISRTIT